ncbi:hypothetical protein ABMA70_13260 [Halobacteriovorax sp. XZX-3]|nr:hypothetical protein C0Z22_10340 [Halobacteriovorax sp. DA5]
MRLKLFVLSIQSIVLFCLVGLGFYSSNIKEGQRSISSYSTSRSVSEISCSSALRTFLSPLNIEENIMLWHIFKEQGASVNPKYLSHEDFDSLASDPDHNFKQTQTSQLEAVSGLYAQERGIIAAGIERGPEGTEFVDGNGIFWDVKTPISPLLTHSWRFNIENAGNSIKHKLEAVGNIHILVDLSYMRQRNVSDLKKWIKNNISQDLQHRIRYVTVPDAIVD